MKTMRFLVFLSIFAAAVIWQGHWAAGAGECAVTYANFGKAFIAQHCLKCHDSAKSGFFMRFGAPAGVDFDKVEVIQKEKNDIVKLVSAKRMPPYPPKPKDDVLARSHAAIAFASGVETRTDDG
jgi:uncharacterized membrane protein